MKSERTILPILNYLIDTSTPDVGSIEKEEIISFCRGAKGEVIHSARGVLSQSMTPPTQQDAERSSFKVFDMAGFVTMLEDNMKGKEIEISTLGEAEFKDRLGGEFIDSLVLREKSKEVSDRLHLGKLLEQAKQVTNKVIIHEIDYQYGINASPTGPLVKRFAFNPEAIGLEGLETYKIGKDELHLVEELALRSAIHHLNTLSSEEGYPNTVVIADIFVRNTKTGGIFLIDKAPQTHAIVLWKKSPTEIVLIDPNAKSYSVHIAEPLSSILREDTPEQRIVLPAPDEYRMYGYGGGNPARTAGFGPLNIRDCIDIAVKMGFEINEQLMVTDEHSVDQVLPNTIEKITNQSSFIPPKIDNPVVNMLFRPMHASHHLTRDKTHQLIARHKKQIGETQQHLMKELGIKAAEAKKILPEMKGQMLLKAAGVDNSREWSVASQEGQVRLLLRLQDIAEKDIDYALPKEDSEVVDESSTDEEKGKDRT